MNPFQELYSTRTTFLAFAVPFVIAGIWFAVVSVNYQMTALPSVMVRPIDIIYGIVLAFVDIGLAAGLTSLVVLSLVRKTLQIKVINKLVRKVAAPKIKESDSSHNRITELAGDSSST
jgi:hypothetical protein